LSNCPLFVSDEKSAIQWVRQRLADSPMTYQELQPHFFSEAQRVWEAYEKPLELRRSRSELRQGARGRWRIPDSKNESHLEQLRAVISYESFRITRTRREAKGGAHGSVACSFKDCWQKKDYTTIVAHGEASS
jgi:hypothetical protein